MTDELSTVMAVFSEDSTASWSFLSEQLYAMIEMTTNKINVMNE
jgi:hypothetical protein